MSDNNPNNEPGYGLLIGPLLMTVVVLIVGLAIVLNIDGASAEAIRTETNQTKACHISMRVHAAENSIYMIFGGQTKAESNKVWDAYNCVSGTYVDDFKQSCSGETGFKLIGEPLNIFHCADLSEADVAKYMRDYLEGK